MDYIVSILPTLLSGLKVTAEIFFLTIILSLPLGVLLAIFRVCSWKPVRELVAAYIYVMRGTPLMLQILFIYYGLPLIPGVSIQFGDFTAALIAFVANYAAYSVSHTSKRCVTSFCRRSSNGFSLRSVTKPLLS